MTVPYSTVALPDGIVIGGQWPNTIIAWPDGKGRPATKPEHDLFQALENAHTEITDLRETNAALRELLREVAPERELKRKP